MTAGAAFMLAPATSPDVPTLSSETVADRLLRAGTSAPGAFGTGVLRPFQRDAKNDFANAAYLDEVRAAVTQILGTRCSSDFAGGELPWRPEFGSLVYLLRFQNNDAVLSELARVYAADALSRWEPRVRLKSVTAARASTPAGKNRAIVVSVSYTVLASPTSQVTTDDQVTLTV